MSTHGLFVISLDFELYWGMFDKVSLEQYGENINGVHTVIPEMLSLFRENSIHATWASVGMLMAENKKVLLESLPPDGQRPQYADMSISAYEHIRTAAIGENVESDSYHYGSHLIEKIIVTPHQELGSHTFSHYYCLDGSENGKAIFAADCAAFKKISERFARPITSIVFPRNQTNQDALQVCADFGFTAYRGTPSHVLYTGKKERNQVNLFLRALRLIDTYINISGHHTYPISTIYRTNPISLTHVANVRGSFFLRPYSRTLKIFAPTLAARSRVHIPPQMTT